jgi:hypothetical protein
MVEMKIMPCEASAHPWREEGDENKPKDKDMC